MDSRAETSAPAGRPLNGSFAITAMGRKLAVVPAHPRLARLLVAAAESGLLNQGAALAALMAEKDIVLPGRGPAGGMASTSDLIYRLQLLDQAERARFAPSLLDVGVDAAAARQACKTRDELLRIGRHLGSPARPNPNKPPQSGGLLTQVAQFAQNRCDFRLKKGA